MCRTWVVVILLHVDTPNRKGRKKSKKTSLELVLVTQLVMTEMSNSTGGGGVISFGVGDGTDQEVTVHRISPKLGIACLRTPCNSPVGRSTPGPATLAKSRPAPPPPPSSLWYQTCWHVVILQSSKSSPSPPVWCQGAALVRNLRYYFSSGCPAVRSASRPQMWGTANLRSPLLHLGILPRATGLPTTM